MPDRGMALAVGKAVYLVDKEHFVRQDRAGCTLSAEQKDRNRGITFLRWSKASKVTHQIVEIRSTCRSWRILEVDNLLTIM